MHAVLEGVEARRLVTPMLIAGSLLLLGYSVVHESRVAQASLLVVLVAVATPVIRALRRVRTVEWRIVVALVISVVFVIPIKRYTLPGNLPLDIEPYRLFIAIILGGWLASLLVDPSVRLRKTIIDAPLLTCFGVVVASVAANGSQLELPDATTSVLKTISFLLSFVLLFYLFTSVIRTSEEIDFVVKVLVGAGSIVALAAVVEFQTGFNVFNHLKPFLPIFQFDDPQAELGLTADALEREGRSRVYASAEHPIALGAALVMLLPLAIYLARKFTVAWGIAAGVIMIGALATISRTAIIMLTVAILVMMFLRPRLAARMVPGAVVALVAIFFALPGAFESFGNVFNPPGGLIEDQTGFVAGSVQASSRLTDIGPALAQFSERPILGLGYGTRSFDREAAILDDQWLGLLLETGILGVFAFLWLFRRSLSSLMRCARRDQTVDGDLFVAVAASVTAFGVGMVLFDAFSFIQVTYVFFILLSIGAAKIATRPALLSRSE